MNMYKPEKVEKTELMEQLKDLVSKDRYYEIISTRPTVEQLRAMVQSLSQTQQVKTSGADIGSFNPHTRQWEE